MTAVRGCRGFVRGLVVLAMLGAGGCGLSRADFPRSRVGALPCFGPFTLYRAADPNKLGVHRYDRAKPINQPPEAERGIVYTTQAGFLDIAHVRMAIDWTRYCTRHVRQAIDARADEFSMMGANGALLMVRLHRPPDFPPAGTPAYNVAADELALRSGQRLAYLILTWHELATWFGHRNITLIDESPSAFTYDDVMAHVVGLRVAEVALRDDSRPFDVSATAALAAELHRLGAVTPRQTSAALRAVEGIWWAHGRPIKRQIDVGLDDGSVRPWLVPGLPFAADIEPRPVALPGLEMVDGGDVRDFCSVSIDPRIPEAARMRRNLPGQPALFCGDRDLPVLLRVTRDEMRQRFASDVDQPWPAPVAHRGG